MFKVLILTDAISLQSGLARCAREAIARFHRHPMYKVAQAGWHTMGHPHEYPIAIYPIARHAPDEHERLYSIIESQKPHFVLAMGDPFYFPYLRDVQRKTREELKHRVDWIGWITIDGDPLHPTQLGYLLPFDKIAWMSEFAKAEADKAIAQAREGKGGYLLKREKLKGGKFKDTPFDPYELDRLATANTMAPGVDLKTFNVLPVQPHWGDMEGKPYGRSNKFVALVVDQNTSRKALGVAVDAYRLFRVGREDDVALHLVTNPADPNGVPLNQILNAQERGDIVVHQNSPVSGPSDQDMNMIYNLATVLFSATSGEGYKLPILEAMATRCLNVMPNYSSPPEILGANEERGILINCPETSYWYGSFGYRKRVVPRDECVKALVRAYDLWKADGLTATLDRAQQHVQTLTWDHTFARTMDLFRRSYEEQALDLVAI